LAAYEFRCCITGINRLELLVASHIKPWAKDEVNRLNPRNGLALNALHDRAYDSGLLTVTPDYEILISSALRDQDMPRKEEYFLGFHGKKIDLPSKFLPDKAFLEYHYEHIFKK
jgi:putative restriction endonuclease